VALFSNFNTDRLAHFVDLIHYMGGQVRDEYHKTGQSLRVTHLIAQWVQGLKYQTAVNMDIPIVGEDWVTFFWNHRDEPRLDATSKEHSVRFHVQPFHGLQIYLIGFEEEASIRTLIEEHGGKVVGSAAEASHIVVDSENKPEGIKVTCEELDQQRVVTVKWGDAPDSEESLLFTADQVLVKSEWFWTSIKIDNCANPDAHALLDLLSTSSSLRSADRKRKAPASPKDSPSRRRLSAVEERETSVGHASFDHSDESLQSSSGSAPLLASPLVSLPSKRQRTVLEMLDTERNYVKILSAILKINTDVYDVEQVWLLILFFISSIKNFPLFSRRIPHPMK
jgi:twin BRCT domain/BRCA1 C Terminus (BRCT) domain